MNFELIPRPHDSSRAMTHIQITILLENVSVNEILTSWTGETYETPFGYIFGYAPGSGL